MKVDFEEELETIIKDLDKQLSALNTDNNTFHNAIIETIAKNPKSKELVQFIVEINDRMETKNGVLKEIISDSLSELVRKKIKIFKEITKELEKLNRYHVSTPVQETNLNKFKDKAYNGIIVIQTHMKSNKKTYLWLFLGILIFSSMLIMPDKIIAALQLLIKLRGM